MVTAVLASVTLFASQFAGNWTCANVPWRIAPVAGTPWTAVHWGGEGRDGGTAYVGYVPARHVWVYEDFHGDGSLAEPSSPGPTDDGWVWTGAYYNGPNVLHGRIIWKLNAGSTRIDRTFFTRMSTGFKKTGSDVCTRR
ncbi:MAG: hypothetical protein JO165_08955 [Candidatus Eremiobacteraeota bacterium]|nr:hypothetical protein [Candidatus Eremiobacteraeota bacterium]